MADYIPFGSGTGGDESGTSGVTSVPDFLSLGGNNSGDSGGRIDGFDPSIHVSPDRRNADGSFTKKRGRKTGSTGYGNSGGRKAGKGSDYSASIDALTGMLVIVHAGLASVTKTPELELERDDAGNLAKATATVLEEFDITPNPKVAAVIGLVTTAGMIYGPKVYMIRERKREEREADGAN
jgi:hypothetical protein